LLTLDLLLGFFNGARPTVNFKGRSRTWKRNGYGALVSHQRFFTPRVKGLRARKSLKQRPLFWISWTQPGDHL